MEAALSMYCCAPTHPLTKTMKMKMKAASLRLQKPGESLCDRLDDVVGDKELLKSAALHAGVVLCDIEMYLPAEQMEEAWEKLGMQSPHELPAGMTPSLVLALLGAVVRDTEEQLRVDRTPATASGKLEAAVRLISARYKIQL